MSLPGILQNSFLAPISSRSAQKENAVNTCILLKVALNSRQAELRVQVRSLASVLPAAFSMVVQGAVLNMIFVVVRNRLRKEIGSNPALCGS